MKIDSFLPSELVKDRKSRVVIGGEGLGDLNIRVGFLDEGGRVISGCQYESDEGDEVNIRKDIKVDIALDGDQNEDEYITKADVFSTTSARRVKVFVRLKSYPVPKCAIDLDDENVNAHPDKLYVWEEWIPVN